MTHPSRSALNIAIDDALRGHRSFEYEGAAIRLATAAKNYIDHVEAERGDSTQHTRSNVLKSMQDEVTRWCERKGWKGEGSAPVTFGDTMALLHSEVSEALEAFRDHKLEDATGPNIHEASCDLSFAPCRCSVLGGHPAKPEGVGSEFADILIRLLDDCDRWGVDLAAEFERKMAYNETRAFQHGGRIL